MEKVHVYQTIFQSTLDTSLRGLQYKIVMEVLLTNTLHPCLTCTRRRLLICVPCVKIMRKL